MLIERQDIEIIVETIIDERLSSLAEDMASAAYFERDHNQQANAQVFDTLKNAILANIREANQ